MNTPKLLASLLCAACLLLAVALLTGCGPASAKTPEPTFDVIEPADFALVCTCGCGHTDCSCRGDCEFVAKVPPAPAKPASVPVAKPKAKTYHTEKRCGPRGCWFEQVEDSDSAPGQRYSQGRMEASAGPVRGFRPLQRVRGVFRGRLFGGCGRGWC